MRWRSGLVGCLVSLLAVGACGGTSRHAAPTPDAAGPTPTVSLVSYPRIPSAAFGIHWLDYRSPAVPRVSFGSVRMIAGNAVTWPMLQPTAGTRLDAHNPAVQQLDAMVAMYHHRGAEPMIVLGPTPAWAAERCRHGSWPVETCAPAARGMSSPWARYVEFLARRYSGVSFEMWNEPNLRNGYNDSIRHLAELQATTHAVLKKANRSALLVSPTVGVTAGDPIPWLTQFFQAPGGKDFDVFGVHLYSSDASARAGDGPEWSLGMLDQVEAALRTAGVRRPVWDTEVNVGRYDFRNTTSRVFTGLDGAAMVARTYALQLGSGVRRVYWYAGDDRVWSGTWMVNSDGASLTPAGDAYNAAYHLLVDATPHGCTNAPAAVWTCRFGLASGKGSLLAVWTTSRSASCALDAKGATVLDVLGHSKGTVSGGSIDLSAVPVYVTGDFPISTACR